MEDLITVEVLEGLYLEEWFDLLEIVSSR